MRANRVKGLGMVAALVLGAGMAIAGSAPATLPQSDEAIAKEVRHEIVMYPHYTIFDNVAFRVNQGNVELLLAKKADVNANDNKGDRPLDIAEANRRQLIRAGVPPENISDVFVAIRWRSAKTSLVPAIIRELGNTQLGQFVLFSPSEWLCQ